jgi:hypothetical protein
MAQTGRLPDSDLADIPGGRLRKDAAASWLRLRQRIGKEQGVWICPTSSRTAYRPYADQQYFWNLYQSGRGALAARPGTSNHGWGIAVDLPTPAMQAAVRRYGAEYGWGIRGGGPWTDAPSEAWHTTYNPDRDRHRGESPRARPKPHPRTYLTGAEKAARDTLVKERRIAKRHGGWEKVDKSHLERASRAKSKLAVQLRQIREAAAKSGWGQMHRKERADYIKQLIGA